MDNVLQSWDQFNKTFTSVAFLGLKTIATRVNYTCRSFIELTPVEKMKKFQSTVSYQPWLENEERLIKSYFCNTIERDSRKQSILWVDS